MCLYERYYIFPRGYTFPVRRSYVCSPPPIRTWPKTHAVYYRFRALLARTTVVKSSVNAADGFRIRSGRRIRTRRTRRKRGKSAANSRVRRVDRKHRLRARPVMNGWGWCPGRIITLRGYRNKRVARGPMMDRRRCV